MRTTVELPDELLRAAKARAAERGETIKELLSRAVAQELGRPTNGHASERVRLPLIGARGASTVDLRNADLEQALADDDAAVVMQADL